MPVVNFNVFGNKDGNVGIGNNAPTNKLHVTGTSLLSANTTLGAALIANNSAGSAGQVLHSNGSGIYWAADDDVNTTYDLLTVVNSAVNEARVRLKDVNNSNDDILIIGANGITTFSNATAAYAFAVGSSTITVNTTGIHVNPVLSITDLTLAGNLTVLGDTVTLNVASVSIEDSLVEYARNQNDTNTFTDALDIGFYGSYGNTSNSWSTGLFRDQSDSGIWKIFQSNGNVTNTTIDTANSSLFGLAPLEASSFQTTQDGYGSATGAALANATVVAVGNSTVNTVVSYGQSLFARPMASANFDAINIAYNGSWSSAQNFVAGINVTDNSSSLTNTVGRFGITYNSQGVGAFVVRNLYNASTYGNSGVVFTATGTGRIGINIASPQAALDIAQPTGTFGASNPFLISTYAGTQHMRMYMDGNWTTHIQSIQAGANVSALAFGTNSTEYMRISNTGNIGIGTTVPQAPLDLGAGTNGRAITWGGDGVGRYVSIFTAYSASGLVLAAGFHGNTTADSYVSSHTGTYYNNAIRLNAFGAQGIQFFTDTNIARTAGAAFTPTERMRISSLGFVGIGSINPQSKLHIDGTNGTTSSQLQLTGTGVLSGYIGPSANGLELGVDNANILFRTGVTGNLSVTTGTERMRITSTGNVGIGTTNPGYKLHVEGDFFVSQPAWGGFPLAPNLIHNSYMSKVTSNVPDGFSTTGLTIVAAHPYTAGFEGPYTPTAPVGSVNDPNLATETTPYWYGIYYKGPRIGRGGMADGWHAYGDGKILKVTATGLTPTSHCSVFMPKELNNLGAKWFFSAFVKIIKGSGFSYGTDAGYTGSAPNFVTKATIDAGPQGWLRVSGIVDTSQITSIDALAFSMGIHPDANGDVEAYIALPYLANVNYKGTNLDSWTNSVLDKMMRQGFYIEPVDFATEKVRITSAGRVGIGTAAPAYPGIHVNTSSGQSYIHFTRDAQGNTATDGVTVGLGSDTNAYVTNRENSALIFATNAQERMRITAGGFVGIGVAPTYLFDAYNGSAGDASLRFKASNGGSELLLDSTNNYAAVRYFNSGTEYWRAGMVGGSSTWQIYDYVNSAARVIVSNTGNVGIGVSPSYRLDVSSSFRVASVDATAGNNAGVLISTSANSNSSLRNAAIIIDPNAADGVGVDYSLMRMYGAGEFELNNTLSTGFITFKTNNLERMRVTNNGVGIGVNPSTQNGGFMLQIGGATTILGNSFDTYQGQNLVYNDVWKYINNGNAALYSTVGGAFTWATVASGTAGANATLVNRMTITNGGNVGIGYNSPGVTLDVNGNVRIANGFYLYWFNHDSSTNGPSIRGASDNLEIDAGPTAAGRGALTLTGHNNTTLRTDAGFLTLSASQSGTAEAYIRFNTVNVERMRISNNGNVGIGTSAPVTRLHIGAEVADDNNFSYDVNTLYVAHQTASNTTLLNDPKPVLMLARQGTGGQAYGSAAEFNLSRYENAGTGNVGSRSRLDIRMAHDQFMAANTTVMTMRSDGNVGIGTTTPLARLDVDAGYLRFADGWGITWGAVANPPYISGNNAEDIITFGNSGLERVRITSAGNIGVGTTAPVNFGAGYRSIELSDSTSGAIRLSDTGATHVLDFFAGTLLPTIRAGSGSPLIFGAGATERMRILSNGNVGIGTNSPSEPLHVAGNSLFGGDAVGTINVKLQRLSASIRAVEHFFVSTSNSPWYTYGQHLTWTGERAGTVESTHQHRPYYEAFAPVVGYREFGFVNVTSGSFTTANMIPNLVLKNDGNVGIGTTAPQTVLDVKIPNAGNTFVTVGAATMGVGRWAGIHFGYREDTTTYRKSAIVFERTDNSGGGGNASGKVHILNGPPLGANSATLADAKFTIDELGKVGIGTTSPTHNLTVVGQPSFNGIPLSEAIDYDELTYFSMQKHLENGNINCLTKANGTDPTFANTNNTSTPFSRVASFPALYEAIGDFIPVQPGERLYGEIYALRETGSTGTAGVLYVGIARYDKDKKPIATNTGLDYFITGATNVPQTSVWTKYSGHVTLPTTHTPFDGSDGGPVRYIRPYIIVNYTAGTIPTFIGGFTIRKVAAVKDIGDFGVLGNFGVGTNSPTSFGAGYTTLTTLGGSAAVIEARGASSSSILRLQADNAFGMVDMTSNHPLVLRTNATERMRITAAGNVGIGSNSPASKLHVFGGPIDSGGAAGNWVIRAFDLTAMNTNVGGSILFQGYKTAAGATGNFGAIAGLKENNTDANESGYLALYTVPNSTQAITERMRISSDGDVLIGGTTATGYSAGYNSLVIGSTSKVGLIKFRSSYNSGNGAEIYQTTGGVMYFTTNSSTTWMVSDTSGRVGIGTTDLANKLEVFGGSIRVRGIGANPNNTWNGLIINTNDLAGSTGNAGVYLSAPYGGGTVNEGFYRIKRGAGDAYNGSEIAFNNQFRFLGSTTEDTSERMRINSAGRITINTTSIADGNGARLTVFGNFPETPVEIRSDTNSSHYNITFRNTNGLIGAVRTVGNDLIWDQVIASGNSIFTTGTTERLRITSAGNVGVITGQLYLPATSSRSKIDLYGGGSVYNIGMQSGVTFGGLQDWAMTFQFNNEADRGFWWGHDTHTVAQGAMALTTDGRLTVAKSIRLGFGESDSVDPGTNYTLEVNGSFAATTKSFVIDHPTKPNHKLRYGSLESPYHGVRLTGEAEVVDGICVVKLPDYIHALCHSEGVNIQLTNIKHGKVLWVDEINIDNNEFTVATETNGNYKFYWSFTAVRKDIEDMIVEFESE